MHQERSRRAAALGHPPGSAATVRRSAIGVRTAALSLVLNLLLGLGKGALGLLARSVALTADAVHSLADAGTSLIVLVGFRIAAKPPDSEHPFGHGRAEHIATSFLSALLIAAGFEFGKTAVERLIQPTRIEPPLWMLVVLAATILVKEWLYAYTVRRGRTITSDALMADAWHHRSDSITTALVLLGLLGSRHGLDWIDPVVGFLVALVVAGTGLRLLRRSLSALLGEAPSAVEIAEIRRIAEGVGGVTGVHDIVIHRYGPHRWISLHVEVPQMISAPEAHEITDEVERRLTGDDWGTVVVHADPRGVPAPGAVP